jgi:hypothetical protein
MVGTNPTMAALSLAESEAGPAEVSIRKSVSNIRNRVDSLASYTGHQPLLTKISKETLLISAPHMSGTSKTEGPNIKV